MRPVILILTLLCIWVRISKAQPAPPVMTRQFLWAHPNPSSVSGYQLLWGTNKIDILSGSTTQAVLKLAPGVNEIVIRAAGTNGFYSDPITNRVRLVNNIFESSTNGGVTWQLRSNYTYAVDAVKSGEMFRTKIDWAKP